jgi:RNA polymerase sigma factor for flagellar operon FliA
VGDLYMEGNKSMTEQFDQQAAIEEHLPLVRHIVFQVAVHFPRHVDREELARAGALGLVEAARRFDGGRGVPFQRFAAQRIRGAILDTVRSADWAPRSVRTLARSLEQTTQELASDLGRAPSPQEVATAMDTTPEQLTKLQERINRSVVLALDHATGEEGDETVTLGDTIVDLSEMEPSEALERRELHAYLRDAVALLPERHRLVIVGYFLEGQTSADLARFLGVTESRVSQLRSEALGMLRDGINAQFPESELEEDAAGRAARRKAAFAAALGRSSTFSQRLDEVALTV